MTREEAAHKLGDLALRLPNEVYDSYVEPLAMAIKALQEPERKHSKWINMDACSVCALCQHIRPVPHFPPYCEMCGALMDGRQEGELE